MGKKYRNHIKLLESHINELIKNGLMSALLTYRTFQKEEWE